MTTAQDPSLTELRTAWGLFLLTMASVYFTYGWLWESGSPFSDPGTMVRSGVFALALMSILAAHELAHYWVAKKHGFALSLPYFIPFPFAFGTLGAVIRLKSLPKTRTGLLEMGAAGPIAGALVAFLCLLFGLMGTEAVEAPPLSEDGVEILIFGNPPVMDLLGELLLGGAPGRYDVLTPLALAGWVGCFLTALNLLPIGQLDGGHIVNALAPRWASWVSKAAIVGLLVSGYFLWEGWAVWAVLLILMGAWESLDVPSQPVLTMRARMVALVVLIGMCLCFMPKPIQSEQVAYLPGSEGQS